MITEFSLQKYDTKETIYRTIDKLRYSLGISSYPINAKLIAQSCCKAPKIEYLDFDTNDICGILYKGDVSTTIALNRSRSESQQNFDCMHEEIHYFSHDISYCKCVCSEKVIRQERSIEYQANEGAAQLLVPYQDFIPRFVGCLGKKQQHPWIQNDLAEFYCVTPQVINNRMDNLSYEIDQFRCGVKIENLELLSRSQRIKRGIKTTCYAAMCAFPLSWDDKIG